MTRFSHGILLGLALFALIGCGRPPQPAAPNAAKSAAPSEPLGRIVERYWAERVDTEDVIAPQVLADALNVERRYLAEVLGVARDGLDADSRRTYDIFTRQRQLAIEGFTFPSELLPLNPFGGMPLKLAAAAADAGQYPLTSAAEFDGWLRRLDDYVSWTRQATANMREGVRRGYILPRALVERMLPILERLGADGPGNVFYTPLHSMPAAINEPQRSQLTKIISAAISEKLLPANRALHEYLRNEYLPRARAGLAVSELPLGAAWYAYRIKRATSTMLTADEVHRIGIAEVERLRARAPPLRDANQAPTSGTAAAPPAADELLQAYKELAVRVRAAVPGLFAEVPIGDFDIRATAWISEPATPLFYQPPGPAANPPAVLYVDIAAAARAVSISSFLTQAVPGRWYQIAIHSGLLVTAAHVITDPIDRRYGNAREGDDHVIETQGLAFGVLVPSNPLFQAPGFGFYPFEWSMLMAQPRDVPFSFRGVDVKITYDIAICKVRARTDTNYPHQPLTLVQSGLIGTGMRLGSEAHALRRADMSDFEISVNAARQVFIAPPQFNLHGSVGKIMQFFPDNLTKRDVSTPGPCFSFGAKIPGGMSGGPIFDKEGAYVHGVVSKGWENEDGPENFSFGSMLRPSMCIPIARMGGKSLDEMQKGQTEGIAVR